MNITTPSTSVSIMHRAIKAVLVLGLVTLGLSGCGSNPIKSLQSANPFSKSNNVSDVDRVFLMAAGSWDRNKDNQVTCDEWKAYATELFNSADANKDDVLDATEWPALSKIDRMFDTADLRYYDANNDGKVTRTEFVDKPNAAFRLLDTANSCSLSGAQIAGARSKSQYDVSGKKADEPGGDAKDKVQRPGSKSGDPTDIGH